MLKVLFCQRGHRARGQGNCYGDFQDDEQPAAGPSLPLSLLCEPMCDPSPSPKPAKSMQVSAPMAEAEYNMLKNCSQLRTSFHVHRFEERSP